MQKKKKKLEEKPIYCSTYLELMLHKTTQPAMSLSFEGYFKIQLLLETTVLRLSTIEIVNGLYPSNYGFFLSSFPAKQGNRLSEAEKPKKSPQPNYPEPILVY